MFAYDFQTNRIPGEPPGADAYWRDVGTIDAYYEANMDLRVGDARRSTCTTAQWPLRTASYPDPPAKFTFDDDGPPRPGHRLDRLRRLHPLRRHGAQLGPRPRTCACTPARWWRTRSSSTTATSAGARKIRRAILDKNVRVPEGATIGYDLEQDSGGTT